MHSSPQVTAIKTEAEALAGERDSLLAQLNAAADQADQAGLLVSGANADLREHLLSCEADLAQAKSRAETLGSQLSTCEGDLAQAKSRAEALGSQLQAAELAREASEQVDPSTGLGGTHWIVHDPNAQYLSPRAIFVHEMTLPLPWQQH